MKTYMFLILIFFSFFLFGYSEDLDYETKLKKYLGEGEKLYNLYIQPSNKKVTILSRKIHTDGYKYFGLGVEYENPHPRLKIYKYTYHGNYRLDQSSDAYEIPADTIFFLIPSCQILVLTQKKETEREVIFLDSELQKLELPKASEDVQQNLNNFLEKLAFATQIRLKKNSLVFQTRESSLEYSIPLQRILDSEKYEITPTGFCRKKRG